MKRLNTLALAAATTLSLGVQVGLVSVAGPADAATRTGGAAVSTLAFGAKKCPSTPKDEVSRDRTVRGNGHATVANVAKKFTLTAKKDKSDKFIATTSAKSMTSVKITAGSLANVKLNFTLRLSYRMTKAKKKSACKQATAMATYSMGQDFTLTQASVLNPRFSGRFDGDGFCTVSIFLTDEPDSAVWQSVLFSAAAKVPIAASSFTAEPDDYTLMSICMLSASPTGSKRSTGRAAFTMSATPVAVIS